MNDDDSDDNSENNEYYAIISIPPNDFHNKINEQNGGNNIYFNLYQDNKLAYIKLKMMDHLHNL